MKCLDRYIELFEARKEPHVVLNGALYYVSSRVVRAWGPASLPYPLTRDQAQALCRRLAGHIVIQTSGFTEQPRQNWYAVICDRLQRLAEMKAKHRSEINRGLRNCEVRQVDGDFIARTGYEVYTKAVRSYSSYYDVHETEAQYRKRHQVCHRFCDLIQYWAAFHKGQLIGYSQNMLFDRIEANYWTVKLHPDFLTLYPGYALFHKMNEFYLQTEHFQYVNDGWRSLLHETQIQDYLIRKFGFRKAYTPMSVFYTPMASILAKVCYPWRNLVGRIDLRLAGLCRLEAVRRGQDAEDDLPDAPAAHTNGQTPGRILAQEPPSRAQPDSHKGT